MAMNWSIYLLRVRYAETDQMGVVYHANYLPWLELGRTELLREKGISYKELEAKGLLAPVLGLDIEYINPAFYDDPIAVFTRMSGFGQVKMSFEYEVRRISGDDEEGNPPDNAESLGLITRTTLLAKAATRHAWLNQSWKPVRISREAPEIHRMLSEHNPHDFKR